MLKTCTCLSTGSPSSKYEHRRALVLLRNIQNIGICMGKKPTVSLTYENETISINNSLLSFVVHGRIYGRFMGFYVNGFLSIQRFKTVHIKTNKTAINLPVNHTGET